MLSATPGHHPHAAGPAQGVDAGDRAHPLAAGQGDLHRHRRGRRRHRRRPRDPRPGPRGRPRRRARAPPRPRRGRALRGRRLVRPTGPRGLQHQRARRPRAPRADRRGRPARALRAHLDGVRRRAPSRCHPGVAGRPHRRRGGRDRLGHRPSAGSWSTRPARPTCCARLRARTERTHGRAGLLTAAAATEAERRDWVARELVRVGTERARSLGWTDCYTFTKALGRARGRGASPAPAPATILRPSIIESALDASVPGLDRGLQDGRAADPGLRPRRAAGVPGRRPTPIVDIVPVDHVVAAIVAALRLRAPEVGAAAYFHVSPEPATRSRSDGSTPRSASLLRRATRSTSATAARCGCRSGASPGRRAVERLLVPPASVRTGGRLRRRARAAGRPGPRVRPQPRPQGRRLEFLRRYLDLYQEYAQAELHFVDATPRAPRRRCTPSDRDVFGFDTSTGSTGATTSATSTAPRSRRRSARSTTCAAPRAKPAAAAALKPVDAERASASLAFFDMDGTLLSSNVIETYLWMRLPELDGAERARELGAGCRRMPAYIRRRAARPQRASCARSTAEYAGARLADLDTRGRRGASRPRARRGSRPRVRRIREHRAAGHHTVLHHRRRPAADPAAGPAVRPHRRRRPGRRRARPCTGFLAAPPLVGESRAAWMRCGTPRSTAST